MLEPNHTHFIIVYNAMLNDRDIAFRHDLEEMMRKRLVMTDIRQAEMTTTRTRRRTLNESDVESDGETKSDIVERNRIRQESQFIPTIHLYIHGGTEMLISCKKAIRNKLPILVFQVKKNLIGFF